MPRLNASPSPSPRLEPEAPRRKRGRPRTRPEGVPSHNVTRPDPPPGDILTGAHAIGCHLGFPARRVYHLIRTGELPIFRMGWRVCARKSELDAILRAGRAPSPAGQSCSAGDD
jgi:hypothetical protein